MDILILLTRSCSELHANEVCKRKLTVGNKFKRIMYVVRNEVASAISTDVNINNGNYNDIKEEDEGIKYNSIDKDMMIKKKV